MELKLEVVLSSSIKRKKPWPRFCWLGQEKESVYLLDDKRISEINMVSGRTKKRTPKLHPLLSSVVTMASSHNGMWLCGLLVSGEVFLWNRDKDLLKTAAGVPEVVQIITSAQGNSTRLSLQVSCDGTRVLLVAITGQVFLWECIDVKDLTGLRDGPVKGHWALIQPLEDTILPSSQDKEASQHTIFVKMEVMGDTCLSAFVFTSGKKLIVTCLKIQWTEGPVRSGSVGYSIQWVTKTYPMSRLVPPCQPVKSRGALVPAFSPDGRLLAIVLNQRKPKATQVLFVSMQNFVSISSGLGGCGSKKLEIPSKYIRSYWVGNVSWSPGGLFLACVLKRGSLLILARLGGLLTLTSSGCNIDFGPAHFLPLHPLVTYRPPISTRNGEASLSSSSLSVRDVMRQRYSVTWHPRLLYLIVSDGYMATVMRVLDRPSPVLLLKTLLKHTRKDLEKASRMLDESQSHVKAWLDSVSCLNLDSSLDAFNPTGTFRANAAGSVISAATNGSTLPPFLLDQQTLGGTKELFESIPAVFEDDSDLDGLPGGSHVEDAGCLEFASMFDTLHALDTHTDTAFVTGQDSETDSVEVERKTLLHRELGKIQSKLLTAWAFGISLGNAVEHRAPVLKHTLCCAVRFAALLHLIPKSVIHTGETNTSPFACLLHLIRALFSFLSWDSVHSDGPHCVGLMVEFTKQIICLILTPHPDSNHTRHVSSESLSRVMLVLQLVSDSLDHTYCLQQMSDWSTAEKESPSQPPQLWPSDVYHVPLLQDEKVERSIFVPQARPVPQRPSSRLLGVWQLVYSVTQQYKEELKRFKGCDGWDEEEQHLSAIMSQIQTALQATGERLEEGPALLSYPGEHLFLCGLYPQSADVWRLQICQESKKSCDRSVFQQTRLCLALLYSLLSQYQLREAQQLGDHMAQLIQHRARQQKDNMTSNTSSLTDSLPCPWLPMDLHSDAAFAVVQTLGRFMASYFTNQPLFILPPHNVAVLPPLHLPHAPAVERLVPLCQEEVARAVRQQHLSEVWTVGYAQDLLLLGGLLPESVWLAYHLGDWKTAVSLSLAYTSYCTSHFDFTRFRRRELHLPTALEPESIFQAELECFLGSKTDSQDCIDKDADKSLSDPLEGEDWDLLQVSIQEILKASVIAGVNVLSSPLSTLLDKAKDMCSSLPTLVPSGLYLPSPPLYCPQPSPNTQDQIQTEGQLAEITCRHRVSVDLQKLVLLLRSGRCCRPAAQWYISSLRRARHLLHKIKKKYSYPSAAGEEKAFPEGLLKFITRSGFFRRGPNNDGHLDPDSIQTIFVFRELCALCWMLHVRDQLSICCRRFQAAREHDRDEQISGDSEVNSTCVDALLWACRLLPFSRFLSADEILQDLLLSLMSELPPLSLVADTLVQAFPEEKESVRVPLREKYYSLLERLRQCSVLEREKEEGSELMGILIQDKHRQRRKHLARLGRHLGPLVLNLWEKEEEEDDGEHETATLGQLSLGTSLSTSTITDYGLPSVRSDGDTAEDTSRAISPEQHCRALTGIKIKEKVREREHAKKTVKIESVIQEDSHQGSAKKKEEHSPPVVGTWEFELEDEEYLNFLELFLSYVLEKDSTNGGDSSSELPLLKGYCSELRKRELHSLTFDVLTTIHRRQRDGLNPARKHPGNDAPVFRAGYCYRPLKQGTTPELQTSSVWSETPVTRSNLSVISHPGLRAGRQKGLFGLRQQSSVPLDQRVMGGLSGHENRPIQSATGQPSENFIFGPSVSVEAATELQQGLDPKLEAQFPELGRLLEWMVRWADKRVLLGHHTRVKKDKGGKVGRTADEGVVIRVKASAPAILTSLSLLERRCTAQLGTDCCSAHIQVPEMQWTVLPVRQTEMERRLERESSVDTGYPGSANTPVTGLDHNLQLGELSIGSQTDEPEDLTNQKSPLPSVQNQLTFDAQQRPSTPLQPSFDDLDVTPEKDCQYSGSEGLDVLSSSSTGNSCSPEASLRLADLDCSEKAEDMSCSASLDTESLQEPPHPEPPAPVTMQSEAAVQAEISDSAHMPLPSSSAAPPSLQPQSSTAAGPTADSTTPNQPATAQIPPIRESLGEDLFRLVQHINYMSLREVLGATFANLQFAQQSASLTHADMNSSHPNVPPSSTTRFIPEPSVLPSQATVTVAHPIQANSGSNNSQFSHTHACMSADQPAMQRPTKADHYDSNKSLLSNTSGVGVNFQEIQPLSLQADSADVQLFQNRKLIPSSKGLLTTTDTSNAVHSTPVVQAANDSNQNDSVPQALGLKLLQLHQPRLPQQNAPQYPLAQQPQMLRTLNPATLESDQNKFKHSGHATLKKESRSSVPKRQLNFNPPHDPTPRNSQTQIWPSEQSRGQEFSVLPPAFPSHTPAAMQGLRLLHVQAAPQSTFAFPKLPSPSKPSRVIAAPIREAPAIKLLHIVSEPKVMLPLASPSARLFSMEELTSLVIKSQKAEEARLQLLRIDPSAETTRRAPTSSTSISSKRQSHIRLKRREGKAKKTEVTFRPNESIIPTQEPADVPVSEEPAAAKEIIPEQDITIPPESFDSSLTGQRLLDKVMSTSAELHAFASTCKRPPVCHDAFTNTDPGYTPKLVDKAVSVQTGSSISQNLENFQTCTEVTVQDTEEPRQEEEKVLDVGGRQFISVLDLEERRHHQDLLLFPSPGAEDVPSIHPSSPTSAQLHVLATSVIRSAPIAADPQPSVRIPEALLKPTTQQDIPEEPPLLRHIDPSGVSEKNTPQNSITADPSDSEVLLAIKTQSIKPHRASSSPPTVWFSSRLSELDAQLTALQNIADSLEKDFSHSRMLVNTIEKVGPDKAPCAKTSTAVKKTVRLAVPKKAWAPDADILPELSECQEDDENQDDYAVDSSPGRKTSFHYSTPPHGHRAGPSHLHNPPRMTDQLNETYRIPHVWADENLGQTELSDTAEILDELIKEGYLSPTDLDFSTSQTARHSSRQDKPQSSSMSQTRAVAEDERRELRMWMRRRQRERLAAYQKHRETLREREPRPFSSSPVVSANKNRATNWRSREEKEKSLLLEQYNQRTHEAFSLASDCLTSPATVLSPVVPPTSAPPSGSAHRASSNANNKRNVSGQTPPSLRPQFAEVQVRPSEDYHRRLGLHRPVTFLPRDRLSQVTRRGMLTGKKSQSKLPAASQSKERHVGYQRKTGLNRSSSEGTAVGRGILREQTRMEEGEEMDQSELDWLQDLQESNIALAGLLDEQGDDAGSGVPEMDWLDNLSEGGSSNLSKIDWEAIERIVAGEEV
ncbi:ciliogenesis and planar polarity effector 1 isoform X3 [Archocentrus centrarchus]|uniref:ciliogenesis and planar polarity effector 1 isoform X3 n=1 Tax=Archocentrus centrarchus TaxID=63155 RepID=UPI0011EA3F09|nr:ciliogenesis and planar polarity effector 1 isoform X3 [Archocentrus centrarchus]